MRKEEYFIMLHGRHFKCDKKILLNIMYDTVEKIGGKLESSDSTLGGFLVCMDDGMQFRIEILSSGDGTEISVCPVTDGNTGWEIGRAHV